MSDLFANLIHSKLQKMMEKYWDVNLANERKREQINAQLASEFRLTKQDFEKILSSEYIPMKRRQNR
jgi:hypothetical protein